MSRQAFKVLAGAATAAVVVAAAGQAAAQTYYEAVPTAPAPTGYQMLYQSGVEYPGAYQAGAAQQQLPSAPQSAAPVEYQYFGGQQQSPYLYAQQSAAPTTPPPSAPPAGYAYQIPAAPAQPQAGYAYQGTYPAGYLGDTGAVGGYAQQQQPAYQAQPTYPAEQAYQTQPTYPPQQGYQQLPTYEQAPPSYGSAGHSTNVGYAGQPEPQTAYAAPTHYIQVAALTRIANAERLMQSLVSKGENAFITQAYVNDRDFHRVRIPATSAADARAVLERVRAMGHESARVVRR